MAKILGREEDRNKMYAMGWGADGQLGQGHDQSGDQSAPSCLPLEGPLQKLSSTTDFTLALLGKWLNGKVALEKEKTDTYCTYICSFK